MHDLAYITRLLDCQHPTFVVSMKIPFICLFWSWVEGLLVLGCCPSLCVILRIGHVSQAFQGSAKQNLLPLFGCSQGFRLKGLCSQPFLPFTEGFLNGRLQ